MSKEAENPNSMLFSFRMSPEDKANAEIMAKKDDRSVAYFMRKLIRKEWEETGHQRTLSKS